MANKGVRTKQAKENLVKGKEKAKEAVKKTAKTTAKRVKSTAKVVKTATQDMNREKVKDILLKEEMKREHKYIILTLSSILIAFFLYIGVCFVLQNITTTKDILEEIDLATYEKFSKGIEKEIIYVATKNSEVSKEYEGVLVDVLKNRRTKMKFLDLGLVKERNQIIGFMNAMELTKDSYTEPMIVIFENGAVKDYLLGSSTKKELTTFLDRNRID